MTDYNFKPKRSPENFGWHHRGYIPHLDAAEFTQFITFRLADSMPQVVLEKFRLECPEDVDLRKRIETYLDAGRGQCWLKDPRIAHIVQESLLFHHKIKYDLRAWSIMPNHAHILLTPYDGVHLPEVMHSIKSFTAQKANRILNRTGQFWQHESFDRYIRDGDHYGSVIKYIENNPVKAGLCAKPEDWRFGSAYYRRADVE